MYHGFCLPWSHPKLFEALKGRTKGKDRIEVLSALLEGISFITFSFVLFFSIFSLFLYFGLGTEIYLVTESSKFVSFSEEDLVCVSGFLGCWVWWIRVCGYILDLLSLSAVLFVWVVQVFALSMVV